MQVVLATRNKGKISELSSLLQTKDQDIQVIGLDTFPEINSIPEPYSNFEQNALYKARIVAQVTGKISIADDSGLEVESLNNEPGVFSARYCGLEATDEQNNKKLLDKLKDVPPEHRRAYFRCVLVAFAPNNKHLITEGIWQGSIALKPRGNKGFGYDPIFIDQETGLTAAELDQDLKNQKSHRAKALQKLLLNWPEFIKKAS